MLKLFLCSIKHHAMKTYGGVEVQLHFGARWRRVAIFTLELLYPILYALGRRVAGSMWTGQDASVHL
jgi:hypothetical protein